MRVALVKGLNQTSPLKYLLSLKGLDYTFILLVHESLLLKVKYKKFIKKLYKLFAFNY